MKKMILFLMMIATHMHASSGIDVKKTHALLESIKPIARGTSRTGVNAQLDNFAPLFDLKEVSYTDPLLISTTDGAGSKLTIAHAIGKHDTIGIDLVALCVNDLLAQGAEPLFFLDYYATGNLDIEEATQLITGMALGCKRSNCALVGGETTEIPGLYKKGSYDIAGFAVGIVERHQLLPKMETLKSGDVIIGIESNGLHAHGFNLVQQLIHEYRIDIKQPPMYLSTEPSLALDLLKPTHLYVHTVLPLCKQNKIKSIAHITGDGLQECIARSIPITLRASLVLENWYIPPVFRWIKQLGKLTDVQMAQHFNMGIGMALIVDKDDAPEIMNHIASNGLYSYVLGSLTHATHEDRVSLVGTMKAMRMRTMVIGSGACEHALAWKLAQSPHTELVCIVPGNAGTFNEPKIKNIPINPSHVNALITYAQKNQIDFVIVCTETMASHGIVDEFSKKGIRCLGPTKQATRIESSYVYAKEFMKKYTIPSPDYAVFTDAQEVQKHIESHHLPLLVKSDGYVEGKGIVVAYSHDQAIQVSHDMLAGTWCGNAGKKVIIENHVDGQDVSFIVMYDGTTIMPFTSSHNYTSLKNGDNGPLTKGMGAHSPSPVITEHLSERIIKEIIEPVIKGLEEEHLSFKGFLRTVITIDKKNQLMLKSIHFNCGDPETQTILMRLQSDLLALCNATLENKLSSMTLQWDTRSAISLVLTTKGFPDHAKKGDAIIGLPENPDANVKIFHSGTAFENGQLITNDSRVLSVTALGSTMQVARALMYQAITQIYWPDMHYRNDIGYRAIVRS